jgi:hypothetical protein
MRTAAVWLCFGPRATLRAKGHAYVRCAFLGSVQPASVPVLGCASDPAPRLEPGSRRKASNFRLALCDAGACASCRAESLRDTARGGVRVSRHQHTACTAQPSFGGYPVVCPVSRLATGTRGLRRDSPSPQTFYSAAIIGSRNTSAHIRARSACVRVCVRVCVCVCVCPQSGSWLCRWGTVCT